MQYIDKIFERCYWDAISRYLMYGDEPAGERADSAYEREQKVDETLHRWLQEQFTDTADYEKHSAVVYEVLSETQTLFLQIGLQAGIQHAADLPAGRR